MLKLEKFTGLPDHHGNRTISTILFLRVWQVLPTDCLLAVAYSPVEGIPSILTMTICMLNYYYTCCYVCSSRESRTVVDRGFSYI